MSIPISTGSGAASVAAEAVSGLQYQQIEVLGKGGASTLGVNPDGSLNASIIGTPNVNVSGSVAAIQSGTRMTSVVSTVPSSVLVGASIFGQLPGGTAVLGSVAALQGTNPWVMVGSVYGSGSVAAFQAGTVITSLVSTVPSSVLVGASIFGQLPAGTAPLGSVATLQGTNPWLTNHVGNGSIITVSTGSVIAALQGASIVGTYAEDVAHTPADKGIFTLGVRNDTLASVTSATGDYSQVTVGPSGETVAVDAPFTKWVSGVADLRVVLGASVTAIAAQGASVFTYVREVQVANFGSASVLVKIAGGLGSTLGWTIAPAGGGSNFTTRYKTGENSAVTASINGTASVLVTISGFTASI